MTDKNPADAENTLILETTQGPVTIELRPDLAPGHVAQISNGSFPTGSKRMVYRLSISIGSRQKSCPSVPVMTSMVLSAVQVIVWPLPPVEQRRVGRDLDLEGGQLPHQHVRLG